MDYFSGELLECAITGKYQCRMNWQDYQNTKLEWFFDLELASSPGATQFTVDAARWELLWIATSVSLIR